MCRLIYRHMYGDLLGSTTKTKTVLDLGNLNFAIVYDLVLSIWDLLLCGRQRLLKLFGYLEGVAGDDAGGVKLHGAEIGRAVPGVAAVNYAGDDGEALPFLRNGVDGWSGY